MRAAGFFVGVLCPLITLTVPLSTSAAPFRCATRPPAPAAKAAGTTPWMIPHQLPATGSIRVLVVFAGFAGEAAPVPAFAEDLFDARRAGSLTHFYDTMSFGRLQVDGTVLPRRYLASRPAAAFRASSNEQNGRYGEFVEEILRQVDAEQDLSHFDEDGDGRVDYVFVCLPRIPRNFLLGDATGIAGLGLVQDYVSADRASDGIALGISGLEPYGAVVSEHAFAPMAGTMAHEFGHALGLPDLYDTQYDGADDDSAGIGNWGLMGRGAHGWIDGDSPAPLSAWSRQALGWVGHDNDRLIDVESADGLRIEDLHLGGAICRIWLPAEAEELGAWAVEYREYLLLEQRVASSHYYNRNQPADGLLVWHVRPRGGGNSVERNKTVDLVCADGLFADAGYRVGRVADLNGGDNLDFWAHDEGWRVAHAGNLGDDTDPFDGERFTRLGADLIPSRAVRQLPSAAAGPQLTMRRDGDAMIVDVQPVRWAGVIDAEVHWSGNVVVDGDLTVGAGGRLVVHRGTRVRIAGVDRLRGGLVPGLCELTVDGELHFDARPLRRRNWGRIEAVANEPAVFEAHTPGQTWYGILPRPVDAVGSDALVQLRDVVDIDVATAVNTPLTTIPDAFTLLPNHPNPFNPSTTLRFTLAYDANVDLSVFDTLGQRVRTLETGSLRAGTHSVSWDGRDDGGRGVASGVYFARLVVPGAPANTRAMSLVR